jgi:hypothetical protein
VGSAEGRGMGALEMVRAVREGKEPRAAASVAIHVLDVMESIAKAAASDKVIAISSTCPLSNPLPAGWDPLQKSN